jgi:hypothetical protein
MRQPDAAMFKQKRIVPDSVRQRMSKFGALIRRPHDLQIAVKDAWQQFLYDNNPFCLAHAIYLDAIFYAVNSGVGSRGSGLIIGGKPIHNKLNADRWSLQPENESYREKVLLSNYNPQTNKITHRWQPRRPIPETNLWFETIWQEFRNNEIYNK